MKMTHCFKPISKLKLTIDFHLHRSILTKTKTNFTLRNLELEPEINPNRLLFIDLNSKNTNFHSNRNEIADRALDNTLIRNFLAYASSEEKAKI